FDVAIDDTDDAESQEHSRYGADSTTDGGTGWHLNCDVPGEGVRLETVPKLPLLGGFDGVLKENQGAFHKVGQARAQRLSLWRLSSNQVVKVIGGDGVFDGGSVSDQKVLLGGQQQGSETVDDGDGIFGGGHAGDLKATFDQDDMQCESVADQKFVFWGALCRNTVGDDAVFVGTQRGRTADGGDDVDRLLDRSLGIWRREVVAPYRGGCDLGARHGDGFFDGGLEGVPQSADDGIFGAGLAGDLRGSGKKEMRLRRTSLLKLARKLSDGIIKGNDTIASGSVGDQKVSVVALDGERASQLLSAQLVRGELSKQDLAQQVAEAGVDSAAFIAWLERQSS
ncbi:unnamed protein product, partial [Prorocentrum cordatum]